MRGTEIDVENRELIYSDSLEIPVRTDREDQVLIRTCFAGVNYPDVAQRKGIYPAPPGASKLPGLEVSGVVLEAPRNHPSGIRKGDRVAALLNGGGYAEYTVCSANHCIKIESEDDTMMQTAAGIPETLSTVWSNLFWHKGNGRMKAGETVLVHGASGGVGSMAVVIAKRMNCRVVATVGSENKRNFVEDVLGADKCFVLSHDDDDGEDDTGDNFENAASEWLGKREKCDVVLDILGGPMVAKNMRLLNRGGRHISIGLMRGPRADGIDLVSLLSRGIVLSGATLRRRPDAEKADIIREALQVLGDTKTDTPFDWVRDLGPRIHKVYGLPDAARAHEDMEARRHIGKLLLDTRCTAPDLA